MRFLSACVDETLLQCTCTLTPRPLIISLRQPQLFSQATREAPAAAAVELRALGGDDDQSKTPEGASIDVGTPASKRAKKNNGRNVPNVRVERLGGRDPFNFCFLPLHPLSWLHVVDYFEEAWHIQRDKREAWGYA